MSSNGLERLVECWFGGVKLEFYWEIRVKVKPSAFPHPAAPATSSSTPAFHPGIAPP